VNARQSRQNSGVAKSAISIFVDSSDPILSLAPSQWAIEQFRQSIIFRDINENVEIVIAGPSSSFAAQIGLSSKPESLAIARLNEKLVVAGSDARGLVYALTELADAILLADDPLSPLRPANAVIESPANVIRSAMRLFVSDVEDKPWFNDRDFWREYLSMLVANRFNRFNLALGLGYDFSYHEVSDSYLHFAYPFLLKVPGYNVRATNLDDSERDQNLEMLRFISDESAKRGLHFQLGLWTHAYDWPDGPRVNHMIEGLTPQTHAPYCRDALAILLKECPNISGITFRTHGESGVAEKTYDFWKTVFDGATRCGRRVEIDLHAKGLDWRMIEIAQATQMPLTISPKFWAEHMGLPYHQAAIRSTEVVSRESEVGGRKDDPRPTTSDPRLFTNSLGSRSFLRYGYGDLLREDRKFSVLHRIWPGTQRLLLWGDPTFTAAYSRQSSFCGSAGCELMEPLTFKGRKGTGVAGSRTAYADQSLVPAQDFHKYLYWYRLWGRSLYNPNASPEVWQRQLRKDYGDAANEVESTLAHASRILPLMTSAHCPSAANNHYWPEMYVNMSIVDDSHPEPYTDTPEPKRFAAVNPLDPQMFSRVDDDAGGKYSPLEVAQGLEDFSLQASRFLPQAKEKSRVDDPVFRRMEIDVSILCGLGQFFSYKLRAAISYAIFERGVDSQPLREAVKFYQQAREMWAGIVAKTSGVYLNDVTFGVDWWQRGHWADRLEAIDKDIAAMQAAKSENTSAQFHAPTLTKRQSVPVQHSPPVNFYRSEAVAIEMTISSEVQPEVVLLHYRHVNQAEIWQRAVMRKDREKFRGRIPSEYCDSNYPLQYYFEIVSDECVMLYPGFGSDWSGMPYFVVSGETRSAAHRR
jgi:hypothetical protein